VRKGDCSRALGFLSSQAKVWFVLSLSRSLTRRTCGHVKPGCQREPEEQDECTYAHVVQLSERVAMTLYTYLCIAPGTSLWELNSTATDEEHTREALFGTTRRIHTSPGKYLRTEQTAATSLSSRLFGSGSGMLKRHVSDPSQPANTTAVHPTLN
jgi:hypothetical protein